jgi:hypothetical protein
VFLLFAPHIGISATSKLGWYTRDGQTQESTACGAAVGALNHCTSGKHVPTTQELGASADDYQMQYIITEVSKRLNIIEANDTEDEKQAALAKQMFEIAKENIDRVVNTEFGTKGISKLVILGGIQINMPAPMTDYFQPLMFEIRIDGEETVDLLSLIGV